MTVGLPWVVCGVALTTVLVCGLLGRRRSEAPAAPVADVPLPRALGLAWRLAQPWRPIVERRLPPGLARSLRALLARAGLQHDIDPPHWIAMLCMAGAAGVLPLLLAVGLGARPGLLAITALAVPPAALHSWLRERASRRVVGLLKELPTLLELLVLCLEAGASLGVALRIAGDKSAAGPMRELLQLVLQRVRAGQNRSTALRDTLGVLELEATTALATALVQAESSGMSLGPVLRAQAEQVMTARFVRAERAAMQAPVKLLLPLLACIFPCTFIVIAIPIASRLIGISAS